MKSKHFKHIAYGFVASLLLFASYFAIVGTLQGIGYAIGRFFELWYLMIPLAVGFGFQVGFYSCFRDLMKIGSSTAIASSGVSTGSMIACCAHHLTDVIPILGISVVGVFLLQYQSAFLVLGIVSNAIGIIFMMSIAQKNNIKFKSKFFKRIMRYDFDKLLKAAIIVGIILIVLTFTLIKI